MCRCTYVQMCRLNKTVILCSNDDLNNQNQIAVEAKKENLIVNLTFNFALDIVKYTESLEGLKKYNLSNQLFRSGTSIGANVHEAQNAESKADFIHKLKISSKEAEETKYWLMICQKSANYPNCGELLKQIDGIIKVLGKIIASAKNNTKSNVN